MKETSSKNSQYVLLSNSRMNRFYIFRAFFLTNTSNTYRRRPPTSWSSQAIEAKNTWYSVSTLRSSDDRILTMISLGTSRNSSTRLTWTKFIKTFKNHFKKWLASGGGANSSNARRQSVTNRKKSSSNLGLWMHHWIFFCSIISKMLL